MMTTAGVSDSMSHSTENPVHIPVDDEELEGILEVPDGAGSWWSSLTGAGRVGEARATTPWQRSYVENSGLEVKSVYLNG